MPVLQYKYSRPQNFTDKTFAGSVILLHNIFLESLCINNRRFFYRYVSPSLKLMCMSYLSFSSYYQLQETDTASVNSFLTNIVSTSLSVLQSSHCIAVEEDDRTLQPLTLGCIASYYYLHHPTVRLFGERLHATSSYEELLILLSVSV